MPVVTLVHGDESVKLEMPEKTTAFQMQKLVHAPRQSYLIIKLNQHETERLKKDCACFGCDYDRKHPCPGWRKRRDPDTGEWWTPNVSQRLGMWAWVDIRLPDGGHHKNYHLYPQEGEEYHFVPDEVAGDYFEALGDSAPWWRAGTLMVLPALWDMMVRQMRREREQANV